MGSQSGEGSWGGNWGNDPPWQDDFSGDHSWQDNSLHSMSPWYGKSLAALSPADSHPPVPTPTSNRFSPISDQAGQRREVNIQELVVGKRNNRFAKTKFAPPTPCKCSDESCTSGQASGSTAIASFPPLPGKGNKTKKASEFHDLDDIGGSWDLSKESSNEHTRWTQLKAIRNYEKFHNFDGIIHVKETVIETVENTSLGVEGWALVDFGSSCPDDSIKPEGEKWTKVATGRRGGKDSAKCPPSDNDHLKTYPAHQSNQARKGSTTTGRVCTDEGSPRSALSTSRPRTPPQPKPSDTPEAKKNLRDLMKSLEDVLQSADQNSNADILNSINQVANAMAVKKHGDYWTTDAGQAELLRMIDVRSKPPSAGSLFIFDYTTESKSMLSSAGAASGGEEWFEIEMTADTGACDTVMPRKLAEHIVIQPSLQSLREMNYEVADGKEIPNLGERRCLMWTENGSIPRRMNLQVADVHKPLLSLSRCADMGFESRFGRVAGALIDSETGEVIPLQRKGNLYVLKCWIRSAPFGRQDP